MADFRPLKSMALSDDEIYDWAKARAGMSEEPPEYPPGMRFTVREGDFGALGVDVARPGESVRFAALARATSVRRDNDGCRMEVEIDFLSLSDSDMVELGEIGRPCLCLDQNDHDRLDLDDEVDRGDMLHLIGTAKVEAVEDTQWGGKALTLQVVEAAVEDEDLEAYDA
jgi:hypothetical protein